MNISRDIDSLTSFKRNTGDFLHRLKKTGAPVVLTVNGKAEVVVQSANAYQRMMDLIDQAEAIGAIRRGLEEINKGHGLEATGALEKLRRKHKIPRKP